jgi:hypothetical protein
MPPPRTTQTDPPVTARAFAAIRDDFGATSGSPADKPARMSRFTPNAISTKIVSSRPVRP